MGNGVLVIDDDAGVRQVLVYALREQGYVVAQASDGATGITTARAWKPDVVLLDVRMPRMNGIETLQRLVEIDANLAVIMITSVDELETAREALTGGAYDYILKPLDLGEVFEAIKGAIEHRLMKQELDAYRADLELLVYNRTHDLQQALLQVEATYSQTILALGSALETRDVETKEHSVRVARFTTAICRRLGLSDSQQLTQIVRGAFLHDVGKIGVPDEVLRKPAALTAAEWAIMKKHPLIGVHLLQGIEFLKGAVPLVRSHHERWDGTGYPDGLGGSEIPPEARAFAVADALDAITSDRPYRKARPLSAARAIIAQDTGSQFCPMAVRALDLIEDSEIERIQSDAAQPSQSEWLQQPHDEVQLP